MKKKSNKKSSSKSPKTPKVPALDNGNFITVNTHGDIEGYHKTFEAATNSASSKLFDPYEDNKLMYIFEAKLVAKVEKNKPLVTQLDSNTGEPAVNQLG